MAVLSDSDKKELKKIFDESLKDLVEIELFLDEKNNKETSDIAKELAQEMMELTDKIKFYIYDSWSKEGEEKLKQYNLLIDTYGNRRGPIYVFKKYPNIVFYGLPAGEEFPVFLEDIIHISTNHFHVSAAAATKIAKVQQPIGIYVFVTPTCPYCPMMTHASHQFAMINKNVRGIMIESTEFPEFAENYSVYAVPRIVIVNQNRDTLTEWEGAIPDGMFADKIVKALEK